MNVNMKVLKDALNKLPDELLKDFYITHQMWLEDFEPTLGVCFVCDEEDLSKHEELFGMEGFDVLTDFAKEINSDSIKCFIAKLDGEVGEREYSEDMPNE